MSALVSKRLALVSFDSPSKRHCTLEKQFIMRAISVSTSIRLATLAFLLVACPAVGLAHPGHGGIGAGEQDHGQWIDGIVHSLIALPVVLSSSVLSVAVVLRVKNQRWESLSWFGAAAMGCFFAAFHLNSDWTVWQQVSYLFGSSLGAVLWYVAARVTVGLIARKSALKKTLA
jgi:hypothetical protein